MRQRDVMTGLIGNRRQVWTNLAARALAKVGRSYRRELSGPLVAVIKDARETGNDKRDRARLLKQLNASLVTEMDATSLATNLAECLTMAAGVGAATVGAAGIAAGLERPGSGRGGEVIAIGSDGERDRTKLVALSVMDFKPKSHREAARFFAQKTPLPDAQFNNLSAENRARAFRLAGLHKVKLVQRARDVVHKAIADGTPYRDVRRQLLDLFDRAGIPRPSLARLRLTYRQNVLGAYNVARKRVLDDPAIAGVFAYRQYLTVGNGKGGVNAVRDTHAALHGKVFAWDDPFWVVFTPPWEWNCRCFFRALTARQVTKLRLPVWTYRGGRVTRTRGRGGQNVRISPHPAFAFDRDGFDATKHDLRKLDAELQAVAREITDAD